MLIISPQPAITRRYPMAPRAGRLLTPRRKAYQPSSSNRSWMKVLSQIRADEVTE
jgi:hypothetical protein